VPLVTPVLELGPGDLPELPEFPEFPVDVDPVDLQSTLGPLVEPGMVVPVVQDPGT